MSENKLVIGDLEFIRTPERLLVYLIKRGERIITNEYTAQYLSSFKFEETVTHQGINHKILISSSLGRYESVIDIPNWSPTADEFNDVIDKLSIMTRTYTPDMTHCLLQLPYEMYVFDDRDPIMNTHIFKHAVTKNIRVVSSSKIGAPISEDIINFDENDGYYCAYNERFNSLMFTNTFKGI